MEISIMCLYVDHENTAAFKTLGHVLVEGHKVVTANKYNRDPIIARGYYHLGFQYRYGWNLAEGRLCKNTIRGGAFHIYVGNNNAIDRQLPWRNDRPITTKYYNNYLMKVLFYADEIVGHTPTSYHSIRSTATTTIAVPRMYVPRDLDGHDEPQENIETEWETEVEL